MAGHHLSPLEVEFITHNSDYWKGISCPVSDIQYISSPFYVQNDLGAAYFLIDV
jgi:hypothetical protein